MIAISTSLLQKSLFYQKICPEIIIKLILTKNYQIPIVNLLYQMAKRDLDKKTINFILKKNTSEVAVKKITL